MKVSVRELKSRLSEYLNLAEAGEEVIITSHRRPVARLVRARREEIRGDLKETLNAIPGVHWQGGKPVGGRGVSLLDRGKTAAEMVLEDRK